jgi:hypothetical protein
MKRPNIHPAFWPRAAQQAELAHQALPPSLPPSITQAGCSAASSSCTTTPWPPRYPSPAPWSDPNGRPLHNSVACLYSIINPPPSSACNQRLHGQPLKPPRHLRLPPTPIKAKAKLQRACRLTPVASSPRRRVVHNGPSLQWSTNPEKWPWAKTHLSGLVLLPFSPLCAAHVAAQQLPFRVALLDSIVFMAADGVQAHRAKGKISPLIISTGSQPNWQRIHLEIGLCSRARSSTLLPYK